MAGRGYCGIAQDVRLLYKTLALSPQVEVTGLVYPPRKLTVGHRFCSPSASRGDRLANQAEFLHELAAEKFELPDSSGARMVKLARAVGCTLAAQGGQTDQLDTEKFWPVLWRLLFKQTLGPQDQRLVAEGKFLLANLSDGMVFARTLSYRRPVPIDTRGYDFLIVQGPRSFRPSPGTRLIARYHDMIPILAPDTMGNSLVIKWHHRAIQTSHDNFYVCNSRPTQDTLTSIYPQLAARSATVPYMLSEAYRPAYDPRLLASILQTRQSSAAGVQATLPTGRPPRYLMSVSTLEPRKNFPRLIEAFRRLKCRPEVRKHARDLRLVIVGSPGWSHGPLLDAMREPIRRGDLFHLQGVPAEEMRVLYSHADALVFPSLAEGFGFPPLEAMQCDTPAIVSDLAEHRWVMGDAVLYCNPYDIGDITDAMARLVASPELPGLRQKLVERGRGCVARYSFAETSRQWTELLERLSGNAASESEHQASRAAA